MKISASDCRPTITVTMHAQVAGWCCWCWLWHSTSRENVSQRHTGESATECHSATVASHQQAPTSASTKQLPTKKFYSSRSIRKPSRFAQ